MTDHMDTAQRIVGGKWHYRTTQERQQLLSQIASALAAAELAAAKAALAATKVEWNSSEGVWSREFIVRFTDYLDKSLVQP